MDTISGANRKSERTADDDGADVDHEDDDSDADDDGDDAAPLYDIPVQLKPTRDSLVKPARRGEDNETNGGGRGRRHEAKEDEAE